MFQYELRVVKLPVHLDDFGALRTDRRTVESIFIWRWMTMQVDIEQKPKTYVVLNPVAGVSEPGNIREKIESALETRQVPFEIYETTGKKDESIKQLVRDAVRQGCKLL